MDSLITFCFPLKLILSELILHDILHFCFSYHEATCELNWVCNTANFQITFWTCRYLIFAMIYSFKPDKTHNITYRCYCCACWYARYEVGRNGTKCEDDWSGDCFKKTMEKMNFTRAEIILTSFAKLWMWSTRYCQRNRYSAAAACEEAEPQPGLGDYTGGSELHGNVWMLLDFTYCNRWEVQLKGIHSNGR